MKILIGIYAALFLTILPHSFLAILTALLIFDYMNNGIGVLDLFGWKFTLKHN